MRIKHRPIFDPKRVERVYSDKDGVPVKYVCTSALDTGIREVDIFYRSTPHPEFGNRYFGLFRKPDTASSKNIFIVNADKVEYLEFNMVYVDNQWHYSKHRWDYHTVGDVSIDGGRAYLKRVGNLDHPVKTFKVKNGEFSEDNHV